jgi:acetyl-CoA acetyltransferase
MASSRTKPLIELHDAFTIEELVYYEALGLVPEGEGVKVLVDGSTGLTGRIPVKSSGGLISLGHSLGLTGLGQIAKILVLAPMVGAGGVCVIHMLRR